MFSMLLSASVILIPFGYAFYLLYSKYNNVYKKFRSMHQSIQPRDTPECRESTVLRLLSGTIPSWLNGTMYRIGPGTFNIKQDDGITYTIRHAFDGLPMVHRFQFNGSTVTYNSCHTAKSVEKRIQSRQGNGSIFFGHVPDLSFLGWLKECVVRFDRLVLRPRRSEPDGAMVGVTVTPNYTLPSTIREGLSEPSLVTKTDANVLQKIHAETLVPELVFSYKDYDSQLGGIFSAAHHQLDPQTGEIFNFSLHLSPKPRLTVFKISREGRTTVLADITQGKDGSKVRASYIHSFYLTENHVIIPQSPLVYDPHGVSILLHGTALSGMRWIENEPLLFHVIHRVHGLVASVPAPAFFTFHVANAFEEHGPTGTLLHLDCSAFSDGDILYQMRNFGGTPLQDPFSLRKHNGMTYPPRQQVGFGNLVRHTLDLGRQSLVSVDVLVNNLEFPRFHQARLGLPYRFVYGCEWVNRSTSTSGLIKVNLVDRSVLRYHIEGYECSEPIFVPQPHAMAEDEGVLLCLANHFGCCYLLVVQASDMKELCCLKIGLFNAVTFHGSFVDYKFHSVNVN